MEFFTMPAIEKAELINNALSAGPTISFDRFAKLFKTWLQVLATMSEQQRTYMFSSYIEEIVTNPQKLIQFNLDGIFGIFSYVGYKKLNDNRILDMCNEQNMHKM